MDPRPPHLTSQIPTVSAAGARPRGGDGRSRGAGRGSVRVGPWRARRRFLPLALVPVLVYLALWLLVGYSLGAAGCRGPRPAVPLLGARPAAPIEVLVESDRFALPPSVAGNRFEAGWQVRRLNGAAALLPVSGSGRLLAVHLGEEEPRTLTLAFAREGLPEGGRLSVRTGDRELAQATLHAGAPSVQVRLPEDLPVGQVPLDLVFGPAERAGAGPAPGPPPGAAPAAVRGPGGGSGAGEQPAAQKELPGVPALSSASLAPALGAGGARVDGADVVIEGNCLVYLRCQLAGQEALVGTFVPPADPRPGQRFELSVERPDGTPIRRFGWRPSFWNRLRGARTFELPLRGTRGPVRVRLISRASDAGSAGGGPGRWRALGLRNVTGEILTPGQGQ